MWKVNRNTLLIVAVVLMCYIACTDACNSNGGDATGEYLDSLRFQKYPLIK